MVHVSGFNLLPSCKRVSFWCYGVITHCSWVLCLMITVDRKGVAARAGGEANVGRECSLWTGRQS
jgi:hypothetical protein